MREEDLERISSRQNPLVKEICGLTEKKNRDRSGLFRFDGIKLLKEALLSSVDIEVICIMESAKARVQLIKCSICKVCVVWGVAVWLRFALSTVRHMVVLLRVMYVIS